MKIAIDAMGGDLAPHEIVKGVLNSALSQSKAEYMLFGDEKKILEVLGSDYPKEKISIHHTSDFIAMDESPSYAIKRKPKASMVLAAGAVKEKKADAVISAGNTGALLEVSLLQIGRIKGIKRPAIATFWPTQIGTAILLDSGANVDCRPDYLLQFAQMGSIYAQKILNVVNPKVGLINIGSEPTKGNALVLGAYEQLKKSELNFIGNIEIKDFIGGKADVAVCDGFVGNIVLKAAEGVAEFIIHSLKEKFMTTWITKLAALILKPGIKSLYKKLDQTEHGGAPLLGLQGVCIKAHGRANARAIFNALDVAIRAVENGLVERISEAV
jgi:phosphate acyltransferase